MKPAVINLTIYQGSTFSQKFQWKTGNPPTPVNLTGYMARMQIREKIKSPNYIINLTTENGGIVITNATNGEFSIEIPANVTASMDFKTAVYDLEFVSPSGIVTRLFQGTVTLSPEVTR
jgi:hypothetical protein